MGDDTGTDQNTARGLDDAGIGAAVGAGVGAAVGDGTDTAVGDECGKVVGDGSSPVVGDGLGMGDDAGIDTADRGWRLADRNTARGMDDAGIGAAVGAGLESARPPAMGSTRPSATKAARSSLPRAASSCVLTAGGPSGCSGVSRSASSVPEFSLCFWLPTVSPVGHPSTKVPPSRRGFPVSPGAYLPRTDAGPPGSPPWRALLRRRPSRWLPSAVVMSETASVEKHSGSCGRLRIPVTRLFGASRPQTLVWLVWETYCVGRVRECVCAWGGASLRALSSRPNGVERAIRSACANVCAQGGVEWSELRRCHADELSDTVVWLVWEVAHPSDETFRREWASGTVVWLVWEVAHPSDETVRREWASDTVVWLVWEVAHPSDETFRRESASGTVVWLVWEVAHPSDETFRREWASDTVVWLVWEVAHPSDETFRRESASDTVVWLVWEVAHPSDETFRREWASDTVVWLVWEVAHPSDETFRRAWGACANVCAHGVERACELSRRATMEWSELSRSACANVCAQGGVEWSELRRCRADEPQAQ